MVRVQMAFSAGVAGWALLGPSAEVFLDVVYGALRRLVDIASGAFTAPLQRASPQMESSDGENELKYKQNECRISKQRQC